MDGVQEWGGAEREGWNALRRAVRACDVRGLPSDALRPFGEFDKLTASRLRVPDLLGTGSPPTRYACPGPAAIPALRARRLAMALWVQRRVRAIWDWVWPARWRDSILASWAGVKCGA